MPIQRVTLFRIPDDANVQPMLDAYKMLADSNLKVHACFPLRDVVV